MRKISNLSFQRTVKKPRSARLIAVQELLLGFPEEPEKFFTLGGIALLDKHLWHSRKTNPY